MTKEPTAKKVLDAREQRFRDEYLIDLDPKRAAIDAGYSSTTAHSKSYSWVCKSGDKPHVYEAIQEALKERSERTGITAERVLEELAKIGFANIADYTAVDSDGLPAVNFNDLSRDQFAAVSELTVDVRREQKDSKTAATIEKVKYKLHDKKGALETMGRHLGMFVDRHEHSGPGGKPIETKELSVTDCARRVAFLLSQAAHAKASGIEADPPPGESEGSAYAEGSETDAELEGWPED